MDIQGCADKQVHTETVEKMRNRILTPLEIEKVCKIFQILSEPSRFKLVLALLNGGMCVNHLTEVCGGTVSAVSHQLRILRDSGIVKATRHGQSKEYSLSDSHIREIVEMGVAHLHCGE